MVCCSLPMKKNGKDGEVQRYKCNACGTEARVELGVRNVLVIPDLHIPFTHPDALKHVLKVKKEFNTNEVVFIGDVNDSYCFSRYLKSPDSYGAKKEVIEAKEMLKEWIREFPDASVCIGNHDMRINKKLVDSGIPNSFLKTYNEIYEIPDTWKWGRSFNIDDVIYTHGVKTGQYAHVNTARDLRKSVCMGHIHSVAGIEYLEGSENRIFGMCVGCLVDMDSYAFAYAKEYTRKSIMSCGVVLNNGTLPLIVPM